MRKKFGHIQCRLVRSSQPRGTGEFARKAGKLARNIDMSRGKACRQNEPTPELLKPFTVRLSCAILYLLVHSFQVKFAPGLLVPSLAAFLLFYTPVGDSGVEV